MLPAEMADGTRAQVQRRREEAEAAEEGDANPAPNPEVVLPNNQDGDNPLVIPDREEDETRSRSSKMDPAPNPEESYQTTKMETTLLSSQIGKKMRQEMIML